MSRRDVWSWIAGTIAGTMIIALTSPWFVRSYVPREIDPVRGVAVLKPGSEYRWRSEGYATTQIGPHGMFGVSSIGSDFDRRLALWGDSQAEGACVSDGQKIATLVAGLSDGSLDVLSFARSGDDCNDWISQIPKVESEFEVDAHLFLVSEFEDWAAPRRQESESIHAQLNWAASSLPDFVVHAARNALTNGNGNQLRSLRFAPGPTNSSVTAPSTGEAVEPLHLISANIERVADVAEKPCVFLIATRHAWGPKLAAENTISHHQLCKLLFSRSVSAVKKDLASVDVTPLLESSRQKGNSCYGFHNGQLGVGHLNAIGNRVIANAIVEHFRENRPVN